MNRSSLTSILAAGFVAAVVLVVMILTVRPESVMATPQGDVGRYQISSWASYAGERVHHSGYYILDTVTGKVVDKGHEIHGIDMGSRPQPQ